MPKKYLLYIHSDRFDTEQKKSGLINKLLDSYYDTALSTTKISKHQPRPDREKTPPSPIESVIPKIIKTPQDAREALEPLKEKKGWQPPVIQLDPVDNTEKCPRHHIPITDCAHLH